MSVANAAPTMPMPIFINKIFKMIFKIPDIIVNNIKDNVFFLIINPALKTLVKPNKMAPEIKNGITVYEALYFSEAKNLIMSFPIAITPKITGKATRQK